MRLVHFSAKPFNILGCGVLWGVEPTDNERPFFKPHGLWVSDEDDFGWRAWCTGEQWGLKTLKHAYDITLKKDANILYLRTPEEIDAFTEKWKYAMPGVGLDNFYINWPEVRKLYDGIIITPYQWSRRLDGNSSWYYSWDCASGCIWNLSCIESVTEFDPATLKELETDNA